jgi:hypothetical protein
MQMYKTSVAPGDFIVNKKVSTLDVIDKLAGLMSGDLNKDSNMCVGYHHQ